MRHEIIQCCPECRMPQEPTWSRCPYCCEPPPIYPSGPGGGGGYGGDGSGNERHHNRHDCPGCGKGTYNGFANIHFWGARYCPTCQAYVCSECQETKRVGFFKHNTYCAVCRTQLNM